ncbi:MAG: antitoxin [Dermatophilaceae bacterium]
MNVFDSAKEKLNQVMGENADKVEEVSDKVLDKASEVAGDKTGGQYAEQITQAREAADAQIGESVDPAKGVVAEDAPDADPETGAVPPLGG